MLSKRLIVINFPISNIIYQNLKNIAKSIHLLFKFKILLVNIFKNLLDFKFCFNKWNKTITKQCKSIMIKMPNKNKFKQYKKIIHT